MKYTFLFILLLITFSGMGQKNALHANPDSSQTMYFGVDSSSIANVWLLENQREFLYGIDSIRVHTGWSKRIRTERPPFLIRLGTRFYYPDGRTRVRLIRIYYRP